MMMSLEKKISLDVCSIFFLFLFFFFVVVVLGFFIQALSPNNKHKKKGREEKTKKENEAWREREMCGAVFRVLYFFFCLGFIKVFFYFFFSRQKDEDEEEEEEDLFGVILEARFWYEPFDVLAVSKPTL